MRLFTLALLSAVFFAFVYSVGCSSSIESCMPAPGETCTCSATDTVRDCVDKHGASGLEYCSSGHWSNCAVFSDGGTSD